MSFFLPKEKFQNRWHNNKNGINIILLLLLNGEWKNCHNVKLGREKDVRVEDGMENEECEVMKFTDN